jgi:hypothetical protein
MMREITTPAGIQPIAHVRPIPNAPRIRLSQPFIITLPVERSTGGVPRKVRYFAVDARGRPALE